MTARGELGQGALMGRRITHGSVPLTRTNWEEEAATGIKTGFVFPQRADGKNHFMKPNAM